VTLLPSSNTLHRFPTAQIHREVGLVYWPTPRCGCTSTGRWLKSVGFEFTKDPLEKGDSGLSHFAVVRDPYDRYVSGLHLAWDGPRRAGVPWVEFVGEVAAWNQKHQKAWDWFENFHFQPQSESRLGMPNEKLLKLEDVDLWVLGTGVAVSANPPYPDGIPHVNRSNEPNLLAAKEILNEGIVRETYFVDDLVYSRL